jgi:hypothetical protein
MHFRLAEKTVLGVMGLTFVLAFGVGRWGLPLVRTGSDAAAVISPEAARRPGKQYVFVFIGSSKCGPSNAEDLPSHIAALRQLVRTQAQTEHVGFVSIGIAREMNPRAGLSHLSKMGDFDEVAAGQGELNQASAHFISVDHRGWAATPQVIVLERILRAQGNGIDASNYQERVLLRKVGLQEIRNWHAQRAPLPRPSLVPSIVPL